MSNPFQDSGRQKLSEMGRTSEGQKRKPGCTFATRVNRLTQNKTKLGKYDLLEGSGMLLLRLGLHPVQECPFAVQVNDLARVLDCNRALFSCLTNDAS